MKDVTTPRPTARSASQRAGITLAPPQLVDKGPAKQNVAQAQQIGAMESGILVREDAGIRNTVVAASAEEEKARDAKRLREP